jgi:NodT family efflux transporter outer membrane factor (OMF) lipoprotein
MKMKIYRKPIAASLALLLGGCMVGPNYQRPPVSVPQTYHELPGWTQAEPTAADGPKGDWWTGFHDPLLDQLEPLVVVSNQTVAQDYANYQQAVAEVQVARSGLFPVIGVTGSGTRQRSATGTSANTAASRGFGNVRTVNNGASLEGNVSWAPDLWGSVRRTIEQNKATAQASEATLANATLSAQVALATAVIELRTSDANIDLLQQTVKEFQQSLNVVSAQDQFGTIAPSDVVTARTQLETAQANLIQLGVARAQFAHAIAVLVGKNPEDLDIAHSATMPTLPVIPVGVPSTILQRRPDIATAERQMAAENESIGIAVAAYYPAVTLSALDGFTQSPLGGLLHVANYVWSLGGSATETIFDGGERSGEVAAAKAGYQASVANYRGTVLTAFEDIENDLSGLRILGEQATVLDAAVRDAVHGADIALNEYEAGTVDYTTVATAQTTALSNQQTALSVREQRLLDAASLIGDLGGGWSDSELHDPRNPGSQPVAAQSGAAKVVSQ